MRRGVQRCPGWAAESPETGGEVPAATGQERPQPSDGGSSGTHIRVLAKHANTQVNTACYYLDSTVILWLPGVYVAFMPSWFSLLCVQLQRTFRLTTGHPSLQHRVRGRLPAPLVQSRPGALGAAGEGRQAQEAGRTPMIQGSQVWEPFPTRRKN